MESGLYIVATPIGNLGDISRRAIEVLRDADLIAAEDTRHSRHLLQACAVDTPVMAYHEHSDRRAQAKIEACLRDGGSVALISDAGTPLISDPGYRLVRAVQEQGHRVVPVPGACAAIAGLSVAGLPTDRFLFEGFLPARQGARRNRLEQLRTMPVTLVFYEAPHRIEACLADMAEIFGVDREATLAREISKTFETVRRAPLRALHEFVVQDDNQRRGEIVLVVAPGQSGADGIDESLSRLLLRLAEELPARRAAAVVADWQGLRKKQLYEHLVSLRNDAAPESD